MENLRTPSATGKFVNPLSARSALKRSAPREPSSAYGAFDQQTPLPKRAALLPPPSAGDEVHRLEASVSELRRRLDEEVEDRRREKETHELDLIDEQHKRERAEKRLEFVLRSEEALKAKLQKLGAELDEERQGRLLSLIHI